jgi:hypothetical protein
MVNGPRHTPRNPVNHDRGGAHLPPRMIQNWQSPCTWQAGCALDPRCCLEHTHRPAMLPIPTMKARVIADFGVQNPGSIEIWQSGCAESLKGSAPPLKAQKVRKTAIFDLLNPDSLGFEHHRPVIRLFWRLKGQKTRKTAIFDELRAAGAFQGRNSDFGEDWGLGKSMQSC